MDLSALRTAVANEETGTVRDIREKANDTLAKKMEAWQQDPPITVSLENDGPLLRIHVKSGTGPTMPFRERSDGLRQFVALVALSAHQPNPVPPILLIDEVETHLHYNAQADLIEVLTEQNAARQIIYTTHSAACLPQDLGLGVRVVEGLGERTASTVRQNFWRDEHPGLAALLMAMGASSLVFVTLRPSIIAEGGSDLILLPTLFREAIDKDSLGFAIVPGAATTPPDRVAGLGLQGVRTVWVLDADDGGRARRVQLIGSNIPEDRILLLADDTDIEIEDLIAPETYAEVCSDTSTTSVLHRRLRKLISPQRCAGGMRPLKPGAPSGRYVHRRRSLWRTRSSIWRKARPCLTRNTAERATAARAHRRAIFKLRCVGALASDAKRAPGPTVADSARRRCGEATFRE